MSLLAFQLTQRVESMVVPHSDKAHSDWLVSLAKYCIRKETEVTKASKQGQESKHGGIILFFIFISSDHFYSRSDVKIEIKCCFVCICTPTSSTCPFWMADTDDCLLLVWTCRTICSFNTFLERQHVPASSHYVKYKPPNHPYGSCHLAFVTQFVTRFCAVVSMMMKWFVTS